MKTGSDKFIWQGLYLSFGMGGTPISRRQALRQQWMLEERVCGLLRTFDIH